MSPSATHTPPVVAPNDIRDAIRHAAADHAHYGCPIDEMAAAIVVLLESALHDVDPVGIAEIIDRVGVGRTTIEKWRTRGVGFPKPRWTVGCRPAWRWADIEDWGRATGRLRADGQWARPGDLVAS